VDYRSTLGDETRCDFEVAFKGSEYSGDCPDCDWAFEIYDWRRVNDTSTPDCYVDAMIAITPVSTYRDLILTFRPVYTSVYYYYDYDYALEASDGRSIYNVLQSGYVYDSPYYSGRIWWRNIAYDGSRYGEVTQVGDEVSWTWAQSYTRLYAAEGLWAYCGDYDWGTGSRTMWMGDLTDSESLPCLGENVDTWSFEAEAGEEYTIALDTVAEDSAAWAYVYIADSESCLDGIAYGSAGCSHGGYDCPSLRLTAEVSGLHTAHVMTEPCSGSRGFEYVFDVQRVIE
jgi:hypothetical protein